MNLALTSCLKMEELEVEENDTMVFTTSLVREKSPQAKSFSDSFSSVSEDWILTPDTKASVMNKLEGKAKVIGLLSESGDVSASSQWEGFKNVTFTFNGDELTSDPKVRWGLIPEKENEKEINNLKLYIYAPIESMITEGSKTTARSGYVGAILPDENAVGAPVIAYTLPRDKADHVDIISAHKEVARATGFRKNVPLTFTHALTALKFKMGGSCRTWT